MSRKRLYYILAAGCMLSYALLSLAFYNGALAGQELCLFRRVTHIPCPSCGTTRSLVALLHGHVADAVLLNPLGVIAAVLLLLTPVWILYDMLRKSDSLYKAFAYFEQVLKRKWIAIPAVLVILGNWIWNIHKGL